MPNPPTLKDIARRAGVSEATASRALHRHPGTIAINPETRDRVRRAAGELGYRPNRLARSLSRSRTDTIGVLLPFDEVSLSRQYNSIILAGVGQAASQRGYALALYYADPAARANYAEAMSDGRVDGGLVVDSSVLSPAQVARLEAEPFPLILVGHRLPEARVSFVAADDRGAAAEVVAHLLGLGHRRIAHIALAGGQPTRQRRIGFCEALAAAGLLRPDSVVDDTVGDLPGQVDHSALVRSLLERPEPPTAVFAWNDTVAASVLQSAVRIGVRVPRDLSIVGFNDFVISQLTSPPLTTVRQPLFELGRTAADLLLDRIERARQGETPSEPVQRVLPAHLVWRESSRPPRPVSRKRRAT
jgi:LacI family transcriptional regulator, repressor for deo operon, udp, cdd, tsx, nupC, and nupG